MSTKKWFAERLEDPSLLARAVRVGRYLAVPIEGKRRGGFVSVSGPRHARITIARLSKLDGFPNLRFEAGGDQAADNVFWGDPLPPSPGPDASEEQWALSDVADGRHYGYSE